MRNFKQITIGCIIGLILSYGWEIMKLPFSGLWIGVLLFIIYIRIDALIHELGHAIYLKRYEGKSLITVKSWFIKQWCFDISDITICLTNEKLFSNFAYSISDFSALDNKQIKNTAFAGIRNTIINIVIFTLIAIYLNAWGFYLFPFLILFNILKAMFFSKSINDFTALKYPEKYRQFCNELPAESERRYYFPVQKLKDLNNTNKRSSLL